MRVRSEGVRLRVRVRYYCVVKRMWLVFAFLIDTKKKPSTTKQKSPQVLVFVPSNLRIFEWTYIYKVESFLESKSYEPAFSKLKIRRPSS